MFIFGCLSQRSCREEAAPMTGDAEVLDRVERDADRVVLCRCGGAGRVVHAPVEGDPEHYVRATFTCTWDRSGPHEPLLPPRRR
jgi:hypothetical protein